jgi:hypothetical protein
MMSLPSLPDTPNNGTEDDPMNLRKLAHGSVIVAASFVLLALPVRSGPVPAPQAGASAVGHTDLRGTKGAPLLVETMESRDAIEERREASELRKGEAQRSLWMVLLAGGALVTAVVQALFFWTQLAMMKKELAGAEAAAGVAKAAADASVASAAALRGAQRAWVAAVGFEVLRCHEVIAVNTDGTEQPPRSGVMLSIKWHNAGQTPALSLISVNSGLVVRPPRRDQIPQFPFQAKQQPNSTTLVPGAAFTTGGFFIDDAVIADLRDERCQVYLVGQVQYKTIFDGNEHRRSTILYEIVFNGYESNDENRPKFQSRTVGHENVAT